MSKIRKPKQIFVPPRKMSFSQERRYLLSVLASRSVDEGPGEKFQFKGEEFHSVINCNISVLIKDVNKLSELKIELISPANEHLGLYFHPELVDPAQNSSKLTSRRRVIAEFFSYPASIRQDSDPVELAEDVQATGEYELLYERLRKEHLKVSRSLQWIEDIQHESLRPLLRQYQKDAVAFMIHREMIADSIPDAYDILHCNNLKDRKFYLNSSTGILSDEKPLDVNLPTGGILADEMGLGKTVEMLALILNNRWGVEQDRVIAQPVKGVKIKSSSQLRCKCTGRSLKKLIRCNKCKYYQHLQCVQNRRIETSSETVENYICPKCWKEEELIETGATIIVSPYSISTQWRNEVKRHISDPSFRVLVYTGASRFGWISPLDLAQYDVVITDYNVLKSEIHYTAVNSKEGCLRHERKHLSTTSPLTMLKWWRVCLDEAQMVETPTNQCTRMVKTLSTVHRWAVTGTPIEKTINNLFGLMFFLDCVPYNEFNVWARLAEPFLSCGNPDPLIEGVLKKIMWRTCKRHVLDQIGIPPQTHLCHKIAMSDVQMIFYRDQHEQSRAAFLEQANKMERYGLAASMSKWDAHSIKLLLEPLRKLRQDCTVPSVITKGDQFSKRLLSPDELYSHLLMTNEIECKSELRTIVSGLNGLAGIAVLTQDYPLASKYYKSVLRRAEENSKGPITVDSLLQIHALHNLIGLITHQGVESDQVEEYKEQLRKLERKYTDNYYQVMKSAELSLNTVKETINLKSHQSLAHWWRDLLYQYGRTWAGEEQILQKINGDIRMNSFANYNHDEDFRATSGIDYVLTSWWDGVYEYRKRVHKSLKALNYFTEKIRPDYLPTDGEQSKINALVVAAAECHLIVTKEKDEHEEDPDYEPAEKMKRKTICELCQAKMQLIEYECKIFDKSFNEERQEGEGTWKPSYQEWIVRTLAQTLKRDRPDQIEEAEEFIQLMDKLKAEYKELSKYWVEINYMASAYDELNMCKLQLNAVDPETLKKGEKLKRNEISIHEIELTKIQNQDDLNTAELAFVRSKRNLAYLKHLSSNPEAQPCPICSLKPDDKYSVWECGHQMCIQCLLKMKKYHGINLSCPVCRNTQRFKDINFVTVAKTPSIQVEGRYSAKIIRIVQEVHSLRKESKDVKIIIFSQWEGNLSVIQKALVENKISVRAKGNRSLEMIEEFKSASDGVTCLLLPLSWGSKGLNLIEATHVFLVEPILNPSEELQAIGRVHRIGQTRPTFVHRFIVEHTIEETIYNTVSNDTTGKWRCKDVTLDNLRELFKLDN